MRDEKMINTKRTSKSKLVNVVNASLEYGLSVSDANTVRFEM